MFLHFNSILFSCMSFAMSGRFVLFSKLLNVVNRKDNIVCICFITFSIVKSCSIVNVFYC